MNPNQIDYEIKLSNGHPLSGEPIETLMEMLRRTRCQRSDFAISSHYRRKHKDLIILKDKDIACIQQEISRRQMLHRLFLCGIEFAWRGKRGYTMTSLGVTTEKEWHEFIKVTDGYSSDVLRLTHDELQDAYKNGAKHVKLADPLCPWKVDVTADMDAPEWFGKAFEDGSDERGIG